MNLKLKSMFIKSTQDDAETNEKSNNEEERLFDDEDQADKIKIDTLKV